jgi:EpsD family peptidyl-prolyl cis-trans isomerase
MIKRILALSLSAAAAVVLCSCGKSDIKTAGRPTSQLRGEEFPVRHVDSALARNSSLASDQTDRTASAAERITDQELLATEAVQARLDRDERVARAIERARRQILAQAYIDRAVNSASRPTAKEIGRFYEDNPALFAERRIYRVRELSVNIAPERFGSLRTMVAGAKNLSEVERWLDSRKLSFDAATSSWAAEQIPLSVLGRLFQMREGQIEVFPAPDGASVVRLEQSAEAAIGRKQAEPVIARYLLNRKRLELAHAEVTKLRERAHGAKDGVEPIRPPAAVKTAAQIKPLVPGTAAVAHTGEIAKLR